ncbi:hypothetical protein B0H14DRAFT_622270 [Mycena olivaceomarginata]|nr:hypothetical protein B0H14DRAFT_622270 [Mycena olivaceomarginata]
MSVDADLHARPTQVDMPILELKLHLNSLEDNTRSIQGPQDGVVRPILSLPHEITSEIFLHCLPPSPEFDSTMMNTGPGSSQASLLLQVCRAWRDVAISTPRLWVCLHLNLPNIYDKAGPVGEPELEKMIQDRWLRTGTCALSFSVLGHVLHVLDGWEFGATAIHNTLLRHAPRLRSISLALPSHFLWRLVDIGPFPALETLAVANPFDNAGGFNRLEILGATPRLQKLIYSGSAGPSRFPFSCRELSVVACGRLSPDEFFDLVLGAPSLEDFTGCVEPRAITRNTGVTTHPRLHSLRLSYPSSLYFLRLLRLPTLQNIHLGTNVVPDECPRFSFISRSLICILAMLFYEHLHVAHGH